MAADIPLRALYNRLRSDFDVISAYLAQTISVLSASGVAVKSLAELRTSTSAAFPQTRVIVIGDENGTNGMFEYAPASIVADDGVNVIVDASARRWTRLGGGIV